MLNSQEKRLKHQVQTALSLIEQSRSLSVRYNSMEEGLFSVSTKKMLDKTRKDLSNLLKHLESLEKKKKDKKK